MLDLLTFFGDIAGLPYCVVKMSPSFPQYKAGEDIDLFCYSVNDVAAKVVSWAKRYAAKGYGIKVSNVHKRQHVHVDLLLEGALNFRFDLYEAMPAYEKLMVKPALFESVLENAASAFFPMGEVQVEVKVPAPVDDLLIRYLEFAEWYDVRPDKIKHLDFIMERGDAQTRERMLQKLHHYTKLPPLFIPHECPFCRFTARLKKYLPG
ncbi:hypothetical protein [Geomonas oryzae]|uniref:hypothetical protein n=1 Tax=Geomonas oryzae TaxID=2364273 RepID=UPI00100BB53F|nr:hypothetical protein [Geomonas oryzae]